MPTRPFTRRTFLGRASAGIALATLCRPGLAETPEWKMKLSTSSIHFSSLSLEQTCKQIGELGFEAIDIWSPFGKCPHLDEARDQLGAEKLMKLLEANKLRLNAFSVYIGGYAKYAQLLGECGGGVAIHGSEGGVPKDDLTARTKAYLEKLKPELELAEKHNSYVAVENHGGALLHTLDSLKAFVDLNRHPRLGIALAPYHLQTISVSVPDAIRAVGKQLFFFYAWQKEAGVKQLPGHGATDFTPWLKALADIEYPRYVNPFMHHEPEPDAMSDALKTSRAYLQDCYTKATAK